MIYWVVLVLICINGDIVVWVNQGDEISLEYTGTHALKRDLVRYVMSLLSSFGLLIQWVKKI